MSKEIVFNLQYREAGEKKSVDLKIDFVSNYVLKEFNKLFTAASSVQTKWDKMSDLSTEISALRSEKPEGWKASVKEKESAYKVLIEEITGISGDDFIVKRFELLQYFLIDNGITDEKLLSFDFWDRCVDPAVLMDFMATAIYKDIEKKNRH